jgi:hypothetical protein
LVKTFFSVSNFQPWPCSIVVSWVSAGGSSAHEGGRAKSAVETAIATARVLFIGVSTGL